MFGLLSFPYGSPGEGFWGEKTSTLNFCEEDYVMSYYCAEVCNTLTNILFVWLGVRGIRGCLKYSHPTIFVVAFLGYMVVGLGSTFFHATLKYPMQLVDELSMIYTTCVMCFATFAYGRSTPFSAMLGSSLVGLAWFITAWYYKTRDPKFHQDAYTVLTATVVLSNMWIMEKRVKPALTSRQEKRAPGSSVPPPDVIVKEMWWMAATGLGVFLGGYMIWGLDNIFCSTITRWRRIVQLPLGILLEGHAWWHLMTGIGGEFLLCTLCREGNKQAYYYITWRVWIHRCLDGDEDKFRLEWSYASILPDVVPFEAFQKAPDEKKRL